jgi:hypothetical protein
MRLCHTHPSYLCVWSERLGYDIPGDMWMPGQFSAGSISLSDLETKKRSRRVHEMRDES